jgi:hypothetical protein
MKRMTHAQLLYTPLVSIFILISLGKSGKSNVAISWPKEILFFLVFPFSFFFGGTRV